MLNNDGDNISVRLEPFDDYREVWNGYTPQSEKEGDEEDSIGIFALQHAIFDRWADEYHPKRVRAFVVGPAGEITTEGTIASNTVKKGKFTAVVDWCGRGGMGSRLFQQHNIIGCLFGGNWVDPYKPKARDTDPYFTVKQYNEETIETKSFDHCGEPCATACKKLNGKYKKDYEPYHALGPQVGVFDQRAAEIL